MEMGLKVIVWPILGHYFFYYILVTVLAFDVSF